jgi:ATP-dependent Clp protease protease subunit
MDELLATLGNDAIYDELVKYNLEDRRIILNGGIDSSILEDVVLHIVRWNQEDKGKEKADRKSIWIYINSGGGDPFAGFNALDIIHASETEVNGVVFSCAASMASYFIMGCHNRYCFPNSIILMHDGEIGVSNSASKTKDTMKFFDKMDDRTKQFVLKHTKITSEFYDTIYQKEFYIYGNEQGKELGIIDYVIGEDVNLSDIL